MTDRSSWIRQLRVEILAAWTIAKKDMLIYYLKPNIIISGMLFPLFMFLAFAVGRPAAGPLVMIPGLIAITILFSASSIEPVSLHAVVFGESLSGFLYSAGIVAVPFIAGLFIFSTLIQNPLPLIAGVLLTSFCFATMGTLFASYPIESPGDIMSMLNVVRLPLIFISGIFIPITAIPGSAQLLTYFSPLTYGNDLIQAAYSGGTHFDPAADIAMLLVFILIFQFAANRLYKKFNE